MARHAKGRTSAYSSRARILLACSAAAVGLLGHRAAADTSLTWDAVGGSGTWDSNSTPNWFDGSNDTAWTDTTGTDTAVFAGTGGSVTISAAGVTANALIFNSPGYSINGGNLTLAVAGSQPTPTITDDGNVLISSHITGSAGFIKAGNGILSLSGSNVQSGNTAVNQGTLRFVDTAPNSSPVISIAGGATLEFNVSTSPNAGDGANVALGPASNMTVSGNGTFLKTGAGILALNGSGGGHNVIFNLGVGSVIDVEEGTLRNGGFGGGVWTNNQASLTIASGAVFDVWDGNAVTVDALNGNGTLTHTSHGGPQMVTLGVADGSGTFSGLITDGDPAHTLGITKVGGGTQTLSGSSTYTAGTTVQSGVLVLGAGGSLSASNALTLGNGATSGVFQLGDSNGAVNTTVTSLTTSGTGTANAVVGGSLGLSTLTVDNASEDTYAGLLGGAGTNNNNLAVIKTGSGTLSLESSATYAGGTSISAGVLAVGLNNGGSGGDNFTYTGSTTNPLGTGTITIAAGASLQINPGSTSLGNNIVLNGLSYGSGSGTGKNATNDGVWDGAIMGGSASGGFTNTLSGTITLNATSNLSTNWSDKTLNLTGQVTGAGGLTIDPSATSRNGSVIQLSNATNNYQGDTTIDPGVPNHSDPVLMAGAANVIPSGTSAGNVINNGTLDLNGFSQSINGLAGSGTVTSSAGGLVTLTVGNNDATSTFGGTIQNGNGVAVVKAGIGVITLAGSNVYGGGTTISAGTLQIGNGGASGTLGLGPVVDSAMLVFNRSDSALSVGADISGSGSVVQIGTGVTTVSGQTSYTGGTVVSAGRLILQRNQTANSNFVDNATLEFNTQNGTEVLGNGTITGTGTLVKSGDNNLQFGNNGIVENIALSAGSLIDVQRGTLRNDFSNGNWAKNLASLQIEAGATVDLWDSPGGITVDALSGSGTVQHTSFGGTENFTVGVANGSGTFSGVITDTSDHPLTLVKNGSGTQILASASTFSGGTAVGAGTLQLNTSDATPNVLPSAGAVTLAGGTLGVQNQNASGGNAVTQTIGTLTLAANLSSAITLGDANGATGSSLTAASLNRNTASTLLLNLTNAGSGALTIGNTPTQVNGVLGWAIVTDSGGTGFGSENGSNQIIRNTTTTQLVSSSNDSTTNFTTTPTTDNDPTLSGGYNSSNNTLTLATNGGSPGVNSLAINTSVSGGTLDLNAGALSVASGGLLMSGAGDYTIQNGTVSASELDIHQLGTGTLTLTAGIANTTSALVKAGAGTVVLAGATGSSAQTGVTSINQGTLRYVDNGPANTTAVSIASGATLEFSVSTTPNAGDGANVNFGPVNGTTITGGGTLLKTGPGVLALHGQGGGFVNLNLSAGALIDVEGGTLKNGGFGGADWNNNKASLTIATGATFDIWDGGFPIIDALNGNGTLTHSNYGGARTVTLGVAGGTGTFSGLITDASPNTLAINKIGAGTQTLTNAANSYQGGTTINEGVLRAVGQALSTGSVTLTGGSIEVNDGITTTAGTLITGDQIWKASSAYTARLFNDASADKMSLTAGTSTLTIDSSVTSSAPFTVHVTAAAGSLDAGKSADWVIADGIATLTLPAGYSNPTPGNPTVVATAGATAGSSAFVLDLPAGLFAGNTHGLATSPVLEFENVGGIFTLDVVYSDAPEPGTAVLAIGAIAPSLLRRRRRKNQ